MADTSGGQHGDVRPIPDPTLLTTAASEKLEETLRNLIRAEIAHQNDLFNEKLAKVDLQFKMIDARTLEQKLDTSSALASALTSQKEAALSQTVSLQKNSEKSETATIERIKGVETLLATSTKATDDKISDLKDRVIAIEAIKLGNTEGAATVRTSTSNTQATIAIIISVILALIAAASVIIAILKP